MSKARDCRSAGGVVEIVPMTYQRLRTYPIFGGMRRRPSPPTESSDAYVGRADRHWVAHRRDQALEATTSLLGARGARIPAVLPVPQRIEQRRPIVQVVG